GAGPVNICYSHKNPLCILYNKRRHGHRCTNEGCFSGLSIRALVAQLYLKIIPHARYAEIHCHFNLAAYIGCCHGYKRGLQLFHLKKRYFRSMTELPVTTKIKKPDWLRVKLPIGAEYKHVRNVVDTHKLHTICESGNCPNMGECWGAGTATFMILGNICTRSCGFCAVATGRPTELDWDEPQRVAEAIFLMKVKHAVITSVDRDELKDGGSTIWHNTIRAVKALNPETTLETLIPDFKGKKED